MKSQRHTKILELISQHPVDTQEELLKLLNEAGFQVTQATVSRDIKEMRLLKAQSPDGGYRYVASSQPHTGDFAAKFHSVFAQSIHHIDSVGNMVVIKCYAGMANAVAAALDAMEWDSVVGTLAGDDTIFVLMRTDEVVKDFVAQILQYIG